MSFYMQTDVGMKRLNNEDSLTIAQTQDQIPLFILCDGVGGQRFGEVASQMAVNHLNDQWQALASMTQDQIKEWFIREINAVNAKIHDQSTNFADLKGMATTLVAATILDDQLYIAHVGDSRVYVYRYPELKQVTKDHTLVNFLLDNQEISQEEAQAHPMKNVITRAIGSDSFVDVEVTQLSLKDNDEILLCSDGLTDMVDDDTIAKVFEQALSPKEACENLIRIANYKGGKDNISVIVAKYKEKGGDN